MLSRDELIEVRNIEKEKLEKAIDAFAAEMKARAFQKVDEGYVGWDTAEGWVNLTPEDRLFHEAVTLADTSQPLKDQATHARKCVDASNFAMFAWFLGGKTVAIEPDPKESDPLPTVPCIDCGTPLLLNDQRIWGGKGPYCKDCHKTVQTMSLRPTAARR